MGKKLRKWINGVLIAVFAVSMTLTVYHWIQSKQAEQSYSEARQLAGLTKDSAASAVPTQPAAPTQPTEEPGPVGTEAQPYWIPAPVDDDPVLRELAVTDLGALRDVNPDVVGWIYSPGVEINYPIVQGEDNLFYLEHSWEKEENVSGSIFLESTNSPDLKDFRSILYGHNMRDGSMFGSLNIYLYKPNWEKDPYIYLITDEGVLRYEIYACYKAGVESDTYQLVRDDAASREKLIALTLELSELDTGIVPQVTDRILTLSTCVGNAEYRLVVHARLPMIEVQPEG